MAAAIEPAPIAQRTRKSSEKSMIHPSRETDLSGNLDKLTGLAVGKECQSSKSPKSVPFRQVR